ncbi:uncharacterized protein LOC144113742 [Amblyomma americanum]
METNASFIDELETLITGSAGAREILCELSDPSIVLKGDRKDLDYVETDDLLVMQAALLSCTNRRDDVSLTKENFSDLGYAQIAIHCAESDDESSGQNCLLNDQGRKAALTLTAHVNATSTSKGIPVNFAKVLASCTVCPLELLCRLHAGGVMFIEDYIALNVQKPQVIADLSRSLFACCQNCEQNEPFAFTFSVFMCALVSSAYSASDHNIASPSVRKVCCTVLETVLQRLLKANEEGQTLTCGDLLGPLLKRPLVQHSAIRCYAQELLSCILAYNPVYKVAQAMSSHHMWTYKKCSPWLFGMFQKAMQVLTVSDVTSQLSKTLNSKEVNWYMLLTALSVYVTTYHDCKLLIGLIETLLKTAFKCLDMEYLVSAILLARHAAQEAPQIFPPYSSWFEKYFGFSDTTCANSSRTFAFLVKFLSDMVPFEQAKYLKVHLQKPAYASSECRMLYHDYVALAKTRLHDLEAVDERNTSCEDQEHSAQVHESVQKAIEDFAAKGKLSRSVIEASIFKKPYFTGQFLPVLLDPKNFSDEREVVRSMAQKLLQHGKISRERYDKFIHECEEQHGDEGDVEMENSVFMPEHLLAQLRSGCKDCETIILRLIEEVKKNEREYPNRTLELGHEIPNSKEIFEVLQFASEAYCHQPPQAWIKSVLLAMGSSLCTVHLLAAFLWNQLTTQMDKQAAEVFSYFLLYVPALWEDQLLKVSVHGTTYMSMHEAVFSCLSLSTSQGRMQFLQLSVTYLTEAAKQVPSTSLPPCVPKVLVKKFQFVMQRAESKLDKIDSDTWKKCSKSPIEDWIQSGKLSVSEWVNFESQITDDVSSTSPVLRQDYLQFLADADSARCLCLTLLRVLVSGPGVPNYSHLQILLQSLLLNPPSGVFDKAVPFATEALTQMEAEIASSSVDEAEMAVNFFKMYCHLPAYCLLVNRRDDCPTSESVKIFIRVVNKYLVLCSQEETPGLALHLFKGLFQSNLSKSHASSILEQCPILVLYLIRHWKIVSPVLALEYIKCEELSSLLTGIKKLYTLAEEFIAGSEESGKRLSKITQTWFPAFVLACSLSAHQVVPPHYKTLKPALQTMAIQFLLLLCKRDHNNHNDGLKVYASSFLEENPNLCFSLEPASFNTALMQNLMSALDFFLLLVFCFSLVVENVERQEPKRSCCMNTALLLMTHIDTIDEDVLNVGMSSAHLQG